MKLSMSMSSSKSTVRMYLISDPLLALLRLANWKRGFSKIKPIATLEPGPQYYRITSHYETLRIFAGRQICLSDGSRRQLFDEKSPALQGSAARYSRRNLP